MSKKVKTLICFLFVFAILSFINCSQANTINKISMDIYIDRNGNANITETWECNTSQGTEVYHPYYNLGNSKIKNLSVTDGTITYTNIGNWDTSGTLSSKANKCGINKISNGVELCWGISSYGTHRYEVKYTITNFVSELEDAQMIYWTLIPYDFSTSIGKVYIKIHTDFKIPKTIDVWGYGDYGGTAYVYDGYIEMQSNGRLSIDEYMTILVKFPLSTFNLENRLNNNFQYYYEMAQKGATRYEENDNMIVVFIVSYSMMIFFTIIIVYLSNTPEKFNYGEEGKKIPRNVPYFRDIPCNNDLSRAYFIAYQYGITKNKTDILGAIILKWLKNSIIRIEQRETGGRFKKENIVVVLNEGNQESITDEQEKSLFRMLHEASKDGYLENKEFEKWCKKCYSRILSWFDNVIRREKEELVNEGLIKCIETKKLKIFTKKEYIATAGLKAEAIQLAGLKRFLEDYTLIMDREAMEVHLFEDYLIYAEMMGIAKKVAKQFKELYPEMIEQSNFKSYDNINYIYVCSTRGVREANSAKARAESYSSGGGGFSSGGGGGGSFGGGGGRRRFPLK